MKKAKRWANRESRAEQQAEHRRELLKRLDPKTRAFAVREFAKLGLKQ